MRSAAPSHPPVVKSAISLRTPLEDRARECLDARLPLLWHAKGDSRRAGVLCLQMQASWRWLRIGFWICTAIAIAVVLRRMVALAHPPQSAPPQLALLDAAFASHATLTLMHIIPALAFVVLTPFVYLRRFARAVWPERFLFLLGTVVGVTAYAMSRY